MDLCCFVNFLHLLFSLADVKKYLLDRTPSIFHFLRALCVQHGWKNKTNHYDTNYFPQVYRCWLLLRLAVMVYYCQIRKKSSLHTRTVRTSIFNLQLQNQITRTIQLSKLGKFGFLGGFNGGFSFYEK